MFEQHQHRRGREDLRVVIVGDKTNIPFSLSLVGGL